MRPCGSGFQCMCMYLINGINVCVGHFWVWGQHHPTHLAMRGVRKVGAPPLLTTTRPQEQTPLTNKYACIAPDPVSACSGVCPLFGPPSGGCLSCGLFGSDLLRCVVCCGSFHLGCEFGLSSVFCGVATGLALCPVCSFMAASVLSDRNFGVGDLCWALPGRASSSDAPISTGPSISVPCPVLVGQ